MTTSCPKCRAFSEVEDQYEGAEAACPSCGCSFIISRYIQHHNQMNQTYQQPLAPYTSPETYRNIEPSKHSGLGIASFITSMVSSISLAFLVLIAGVMEASTPGGIDDKSGGAMALGLLIFAFMALALVALGLGIWGLLQKGRKKIFAILGTVFSSTALIVTLFLMILGLAAG